MNSRLLFIFLLLSNCFLLTCNDSIVDSLSNGNYNYTAYDSLGIVVAEGKLFFKFQDSSNVKGEWEIKKVGNPQNIGPQIGKGKLEGELTDGQLMIGLNPDYVDNNVTLVGEIENNIYSGSWFYSSFIGLTNYGLFEAKKK